MGRALAEKLPPRANDRGAAGAWAGAGAVGPVSSPLVSISASVSPSLLEERKRDFESAEAYNLTTSIRSRQAFAPGSSSSLCVNCTRFNSSARWRVLRVTAPALSARTEAASSPSRTNMGSATSSRSPAGRAHTCTSYMVTTAGVRACTCA
jgi:hypothetical protein